MKQYEIKFLLVHAEPLVYIFVTELFNMYLGHTESKQYLS